MSKPSVPQGTRDFGAETVRKRSYILNTITKVFNLYGFQPLETPAMENLETLMGKYGEEGDKLIFRVLNNGLSDPKNQEKAKAAFDNILHGKNDKNITERALRYDLTIPFARYVAMNHGQLNYPFKRYQVQPVWRADRPQRGRYREFYQCDADVVGSRSLLNEVDLINIYHDVFSSLKMEGYELRINSRKVLAGLAEKCGSSSYMENITTAIDKLDKIGLEKVKDELSQRGMNNVQVSTIAEFLNVAGTNQQKIHQARALLSGSDIARDGLDELSYVNHIVEDFEHAVPLIIDFTLARGLNYYTGAIFEVKAPSAIQIGSIGGGGRYDDLTGLFGIPGVPGVGISFGVDRIYDVMEELKLFPEDLHVSTRVLFLMTDEQETRIRTVLKLIARLRNRSIGCEMYSDLVKTDKQYKYAERKNIPYVITVGEEEMEKKICRIKNIRTGKLDLISFEDITAFDFN